MMPSSKQAPRTPKAPRTPRARKSKAQQQPTPSSHRRGSAGVVNSEGALEVGRQQSR